MKLLALDPSSSAIGYAVMDSPRMLFDAGVILPVKGEKDPIVRVTQMLEDLKKLIGEHSGTPGIPVSHLRRVIIEMPSRHQRKRSGSTGAGASLMVYGMACGAVWQACRCWLDPDRVETIGSGQWSRAPKDVRQVAIAAQFKNYNAAHDKGGDCSDAISIGQWWYARRIGQL